MNEISSIRPAEYLNVEAEQQLLGMILTNNGALDLVSDILKPELFGDPLHARIYEICTNRIAKGHLVSPVALKSILENDEGLKQLGGPAYLARMAGAAITPKAAREYAKLIIEQAARRVLQGAVAEASSGLFAGSESAEVKAGLLQALHALPEASGEETTFSLMKAVTEAVDAAIKSYQGENTFLKTGVEPLDRVIRGLGPGDYCLLGGATSMGKTSLALEIAANVAIKQRKGVCFVSLEMTRHELATRMASAVARVPYTELRSASDMEEANFRKWVEAAQAIADAPMEIIPKHVRDLPAIHAAARKVQRSMGDSLSLLVVDYAQLVRAPGKGRYEQMTDVSIGIKHVAGLLGVPVIALCQLSRDIGMRDDKRPQLSDIKESGQFENDADQVVFCHREGYWLQRQGPKLDKSGQITDKARIEWEADMAACKNVMDLIVRKNRHGKLGTAQVGFHDATNRFWSLNQRDDDEERF
ncbi:MAG: replicative DNA helicase [Cereibacter sphaeroides]|uniref:DNA 5'-3' helicase n=1 Tax=Cereibacter sphaeroides TaxID=1063 RepID=A0A2W5U6W6_CERSP|nr:MAG: replicative DNA helicase [Cereibacter sphaeroides]